MARKKKVIMSSQDIERALDRIALQILERNLRLAWTPSTNTW